MKYAHSLVALIGFMLISAVVSCSQSEKAQPDVSAQDVEPDVVNCDDENPCTKDSLLADGTCDHTALAGTGCDDGNACTADDKCSAEGQCVGSTSQTCDDKNACTKDSCDSTDGCVYEPLTVDEECDGNLCSVGDSCQAGECQSGESKECNDPNPDDCVYLECKPASGMCDHTLVHPEGHPCKDGNPCTDDDSCDANGQCKAGSAHSCVAQHPCKKAWCNEQAKEGTNPCLLDWKDEGVGCDDGDACTENDTCVILNEGPDLKCSGAAVDCNDGNSCTADSCEEEVGCQFEDKVDGSPCDLSPEFCGAKGECQDGECEAEGVEVCDDEIACTVDSCSEAGECTHEPDHTACADGLFCNGAETCDPAEGCLAGEPPVLDDAIGCTVDSCDEDADDVLHVPDDSLCTDSDVCNGVETCVPAEGDTVSGCLAGAAPELSDDLDCTVDTCDPVDGPVHTPDHSLCDDAKECTTDTCDPNVAGGCINAPVEEVGCCLEENAECDDGNPCTLDVCDLETHACLNTNIENGTECDDAQVCTVGDACQDGVCQGSENPCDDEIDCTVDSCDANVEGGCVHAPNSDLCNDQIGCTDDECVQGVGCENTPDDTVCADAFECTLDECKAGLGCSNVPQDSLCDDQVSCTVDMCVDGVGCANDGDDSFCDDGNPCVVNTCDNNLGCQEDYLTGEHENKDCCIEENAECDDQNPCTIDQCDLETHWCEESLEANGQPCIDDDQCTENTKCQDGQCVGDQIDCSDLFPCTVDTCDNALGCQHATDDQVCNDGNECNAGFCDGDNGCQYENLDGQDCDDKSQGTVDDFCDQDTCTGLPDPDGDGIANEGYDSGCTNGQAEGCNDNCPETPNPDQVDEDANGMGDVCDCDPSSWCDPDASLAWQNPPAEALMKWSPANSYCEALTLDGHVDWRLPTPVELCGLVLGCDKCVGAEGVTGGCTGGNGPAAGCYWPLEILGDCGWYWTNFPKGGLYLFIDFQDGHMGDVNGTESSSHVRCVRDW